MKIDEFREIHKSFVASNPKIFALVAPDPPASPDQLDSVERLLGMVLPRDYRKFLAEYGGGCFGFTNVFSADESSDYFLPRRRAEATDVLPTDLLPFSDDNAGGFYVLSIRDGRLHEEVSYWNADGGLVRTSFGSVLDFIARYAYQSA